MASQIQFTVDKTIFDVALEELERCDRQAVAEFLNATNWGDLFELEIVGNRCVAYPSRLFLGFLAECESLGLVD